MCVETLSLSGAHMSVTSVASERIVPLGWRMAVCRSQRAAVLNERGLPEYSLSSIYTPLHQPALVLAFRQSCPIGGLVVGIFIHFSTSNLNPMLAALSMYPISLLP